MKKYKKWIKTKRNIYIPCKAAGFQRCFNNKNNNNDIKYSLFTK